MEYRRNILQRVGTPASDKQEEHSNMDIKQEGPFLVPPLWKDNMSLENIANDFLESNVTGEVMNLDDFLKELQQNDMVPQPEPQPKQDQSRLQAGAHLHQQRNQDMQERYNLIRPTSIDTLKEVQTPVRPPIMHHVGKPPDLYQHPVQQELMPGHQPMQSPKDHGIPQASVRPLVRPVNPSPERQDRPNSAKQRTISEQSEEDDEDLMDEEDESGFSRFSLVNFSQDDLRLATIPGQGQEFDPATRKFAEEELKPQPIIRKRKKQFVPDELKNNKYWAKRCKNNEAAKRSREARRLKENQIAMRARYLEEENNALKGEMVDLKKENTDLKQMVGALEEKLSDTR